MLAFRCLAGRAVHARYLQRAGTPWKIEHVPGGLAAHFHAGAAFGSRFLEQHRFSCRIESQVFSQIPDMDGERGYSPDLERVAGQQVLHR